jgi:hypothetical protein
MQSVMVALLKFVPLTSASISVALERDQHGLGPHLGV